MVMETSVQFPSHVNSRCKYHQQSDECGWETRVAHAKRSLSWHNSMAFTLILSLKKAPQNGEHLIYLHIPMVEL